MAITREQKQKNKDYRQNKARNIINTRSALRHFPEGYSKDIRRFADDIVLLHSRYIFVMDKNTREDGYCTHCRQIVGLPGETKHNEYLLCTNCYSACIVKHDWRGHSKLIDKAYFHYFEKSKTDPQAIICRGIFAYRDYSHEFRDIETTFETHTLYVFQMGKTVMIANYAHYWYGINQYGDYYKLCKSIYPIFSKYKQIKNIVLDVSIDSIEKAVEGTPFQYSEWRRYYEKYNLADGFVKYFDLYAKHPCIEYIAKIGLARLIESRIQGEPTLGALNLNGKTLPQVLRMKLNKPEIKELKEHADKINANDLKIWQLAKKDGSDLSLIEIIQANLSGEKIKLLTEFTSVKKIFWYIKRQQVNSKSINAGYILGDWADYIEDCKLLELDLKEESVIFPRDLHQAHQNTMKQIKIQSDALLNKKIGKRLPGLAKQFTFERGDFIIRPAMSSEDLIQESKYLHHCVAAHYTQKYADGKTNILLIRRRVEPDKPFYTMEVDNKNRIIQTRGLKNCGTTPEVQAFVKQFNEMKLQNNGVKSA